MTRGIRLAPGGAINRPTEIGVRLTPLGVPPPARAVDAPPPPPCEVICNDGVIAYGWTSANGVATGVSGVSGFPLNMMGGPWTLQFTWSGNACGGVVTFDVTGDFVEGTDYVRANDWLFGMKGCEPPYAGAMFVQMKLNGEDWCALLEIDFSGEGGGCGAGPDDGCFVADSPGTPIGPSNPVVTFQDIGPNAGGAPLLFYPISSPPMDASFFTVTGDGTNYTVTYSGTEQLDYVTLIAAYDEENVYCDGQGFSITGTF